MPMVLLQRLLAWNSTNAVPSPCDSSLHASRAYRIPAAAALEAVIIGEPRVRPNYQRVPHNLQRTRPTTATISPLPNGSTVAECSACQALDHCKTAVLNSLGSPPSRSGKSHRVGAIPRAV